MTSFKNLSLKSKLGIMVAAPLLLASYFIISSLISYNSHVSEMSKAQNLSEVVIAASQVVHELQKERGASAVYMTSKGQKFKPELQTQRRNSNQAIANYSTYASKLNKNDYNEKLQRLLVDINRRLAELKDLRPKIMQLSVPIATAIATMTDNNNVLLSINTLLSASATRHEISRMAIAYEYFLQAKERAGLERAVISSAFIKDSASRGQQQKYITLAVEENRYMALFRELASGDVITMVDRELSGPAVRDVAAMRDVAWGRSDNFGIDAEQWFKKATVRINLLRNAELKIQTNFQEYLAKQASASSRQFYLVLVIAVFAITLTIVLCFFTIRLIGRQVGSISSALRKMSQYSDLGAHAETFAKDDMGQLAEDFNIMVAHMKGLIAGMQTTEKHLTYTLQSLQTISTSVTEQVDEGSCQTGMAAVAMNQMKVTVEDVAHNCSIAAAQSKQANQSAGEGNEMLQVVKQDMQSLDRELKSTHTIIEQLASDSSEIGSILDVIHGVAEQTNLLALNAAIEAARAGEQGRGFAVVADEVRSLAYKTQDSTGQIQSNIEKLQVGSRKAVAAINASLQLAETTDNSIDNTVSNIMQVITQIDDVNKMNTQIAAATDQQASSVEEINRNVKIIQERYSETNSSVTDLKKTNQDILQVSQSISDSISKFKL